MELRNISSSKKGKSRFRETGGKMKTLEELGEHKQLEAALDGEMLHTFGGRRGTGGCVKQRKQEAKKWRNRGRN